MRAALGLLFLSIGCAPLLNASAPPREAAVTTVQGDAPQIQPSEEPADDDATEHATALIRPCADGPERQAAQATYDALDARMAALGDADDPKPLAKELDALLATDCFRLSSGDPHDALAFDSGESLRTWWQAGGSDWVSHYLSLEDSRVVLVPPTPRKTLRKLAPISSPIASLVCDDASCGKDTVAFARRADRAFELRMGARTWRESETCEKEALEEKDASLRYSAFRSCIENATPRQTAMPLGKTKAPRSGWLVAQTSGRCAELRAYDLATGAAWIAKDGCTGKPIASGRVPVALVREAAWMMLLAPTVERRVRTRWSTFEVPKSIAIEEPFLHFGASGGYASCCGVRRSRPWSWMREKGGAWRGQASGILYVGSSCDDAQDHAGELLQIVDDAFEEGCTPAAPPRFAWNEPGEAVAGYMAAAFDDPQYQPLRDVMSSTSVLRRSASLPGSCR
ncbi:MAG TPA: hypothetical protein VIF62_16405 [Labilithrix sp.]